MDIQTDKKSKNEDIDMLMPIEQYIEVDDFFIKKMKLWHHIVRCGAILILV